jgi:MFS transporter, MFS domain-containing protein family, molybdate-anion transporter
MLTFISSCFEGTNFLVLFYWPKMLQEAHKLGVTGAESIPNGLIFATLMAAMILGALLHSVLSNTRPSTHSSHHPSTAKPQRVPEHLLLGSATAFAALCVIFLASVKTEMASFGVLLVFEMCNGAYLPSIASWRGRVVQESSRTGLYGMMKLPLFIFVVLSLELLAVGKFSKAKQQATMSN